jgi:lantibiotic modifying enzyme
MADWAPLVEGDAAARALAAAEAIGRDLAAFDSPSGLSLSRGHPGLALFFAYLERTLGSAAAGERARHHLDRAIDGLAEPPAPSPSLYAGFTGVAWVAEHLAAGESAADPDDADDENGEIDAALLALLGRSPWRGDFDLLGGLVGWGVYALERRPHPSAAAILQLVVARLAECAEPARGGVVWREPRNPSHPPDPGMAHGAAGVIALLARMLSEGVASHPETAPLLAAAVDGVLAGLSPAGDGPESDLAWCAGDAGLSVALLAAGRAAGRSDWERAGRGLAGVAAGRYLQGAEGFDPALCHGTAGLSHLFHRLYQTTGDPALLGAAHRWLERTLASRRPGRGIGGFLCRGRVADGKFDWIAEPGYLGGVAGVGLALLAAATPVEPGWDRLLLLSGSPEKRL